MTLTPKQETFCREYLCDLNGTQAATRAGYSAETAYSIAEELLRKPEIQKVVKSGQKARAERTQIDADYVLARIKLTIERCSGEGAAFDPGNVLKGCDLLARHLGMFKADNDQKDRLVIIKDFTGDMK